MGKPAWARTADTARKLRPRRVVWWGKSTPAGIEPISTRALAATRDTILFLRAGLVCLEPATLRRLVARAAKAPSGLFPRDGGMPVAIAVRAPSVFGSSFGAISRRLRPSPVFAKDEELLVVDGPDAWARAQGVLRRRSVQRLIRRGVLIPDPGSVYVVPEARVGKGTVLSPWVILEGDTRIGGDCVIGSFCHIEGSRVGRGTRILDHCFIRDSRIGKDASIGPFAHLRPESAVGDRARVGNYVELKKASLGTGAKAPHLSYIGDATVGRGANIGAGTITCNYDGAVKHRTVIGDGAFIGSDVQLVAPVRVGKGAFVAAGSCIVNDVPAHALALARSRQIIKKNWAKRRKGTG